MKPHPEILTPFDVRCVERTRFPQPVSRSRWGERATFGLSCAIAGALFTLVCVGLAVHACHP